MSYLLQTARAPVSRTISRGNMMRDATFESLMPYSASLAWMDLKRRFTRYPNKFDWESVSCICNNEQWLFRFFYWPPDDRNAKGITACVIRIDYGNSKNTEYHDFNHVISHIMNWFWPEGYYDPPNQEEYMQASIWNDFTTDSHELESKSDEDDGIPDLPIPPNYARLTPVQDSDPETMYIELDHLCIQTNSAEVLSTLREREDSYYDGALSSTICWLLRKCSKPPEFDLIPSQKVLLNYKLKNTSDTMDEMNALIKRFKRSAASLRY